MIGGPGLAECQAVTSYSKQPRISPFMGIDHLTLFYHIHLPLEFCLQGLESRRGVAGWVLPRPLVGTFGCGG